MKYNKENPLRVFEAFAGYGSQSLALERLKRVYPDFDFVNIGISEIEDTAIAAFNALHPGVKNYGDISKINWDEVPDFDLFTYSSPCFVAGTKILTDTGYKSIEDIKEGDYVLTHSNMYRKVMTPKSRVYDGDMYTIKAMCVDSIECTAEHPFYVRRMYHAGHKSERLFHEPEWIKAKNLDTNCYLGYAINTESRLPQWNGVEDNRWGHHKKSNKLTALLSNTDFWYVMGRYVGDGWTRINEANGNGLVIACGDRNRESLETALTRLDKNYCMIKERTSYKCQVSGNEWCKFVERYGYKAGGKHIDHDTLCLPVELLKSFLRGYIDSDGCFTNGWFKATTISRELAYGVGQVVAKVYHRPFSIYKVRRNPVTIIEGRTVNQHDTYSVVWRELEQDRTLGFYEGGCIWIPLKHLPSVQNKKLTVYNMSVELDESYTANGVIVHNCQDFSQAGLQKGGTEGTGTRSSLLWECRRAIVAKRPKFLLLENVAALVSAKFLPLFNKWRDELSSYGYNNFAEVLNAKEYGVPQNRERIFLVSIRDDGENPQYYFPNKMPLEHKLRDVLEETVDTKYYLNPNKVDQFVRDNMVMIEKYTREDDGTIEKLPDSLREWLEEWPEDGTGEEQPDTEQEAGKDLFEGID